MTAAELWQAYIEANDIKKDEPYEAWAFGGAPDKLAQLVIQGEKVATASAYPLYEMEKEPLPKVGGYSVILNAQNEAVCIIQTTKVYTVPFCEVTQEHAFKEGEGDKSLSYWRKVHIEFFKDCMAEYHLAFDEKMLVVCEEFKCVYKPQSRT